MMNRAVKSLQPFEFRSDFRAFANEDTAPAETEAEGQITLTGHELAELLSFARSEGIAEALQLQNQEDSKRLSGVTSKLNEALANLVALAEHLENVGAGSDIADTSLQLINAAAKRIIDGQGDLFAKSDHEPDRHLSAAPAEDETP